MGGHAIVSLDGIPALVEFARRLGRGVQENPNEYVDSLDYLTEGSLTFDEAFAALKRQATEDHAIASYVALEQKRLDEQRQRDSDTEEQKAARKVRHRDEILREYPVERIIAAASSHHASRGGLYSRFGRWARVEDLNIVLQHLSVESDTEACLGLLWVFGTATLPRLDARIWALANDISPRVRAAAVKALASVTDQRVGELGRERLRDGNFSAANSSEIELFVRNYQDGDGELILAALERLTPNDDEAHDLGMSARRVCEHNSSPGVAGLAMWIYRTNPCTICRGDAVESLLRSNSLPEDIADECLHDASTDVRESVIRRPPPIPCPDPVLGTITSINTPGGHL